MADENNEIVIVDDKTIQEKIYFIRGQNVMLDADLAEIYGYETKNFNRQVKIILKILNAKILCFN